MDLLTWRKSCKYINHVKERTLLAVLRCHIREDVQISRTPPLRRPPRQMAVVLTLDPQDRRRRAEGALRAWLTRTLNPQRTGKVLAAGGPEPGGARSMGSFVSIDRPRRAGVPSSNLGCGLAAGCWEGFPCALSCFAPPW